ncbi:unnamed protein product, partial [Prorocentrum cordatum]
ATAQQHLRGADFRSGEALAGLALDAELRKAEAAGARARALFQELGDMSGAAEALLVILRSAGALGQAVRARRLVEEALAKARAEGDRCGEGASLLGLAEVQAEQRGSQAAAEALETAGEAVEAWAKSEWAMEELEVTALLLISRLHGRTGGGDHARKRAEEALKLAESTEDIAVRCTQSARVHQRLAVLAVEGGDGKLAREFADNSWRLLREQGSPEAEAEGHLDLARELLRGRFAKEALRESEEALQGFRACKTFRRQEVVALSIVAEAHVMLGEENEAHSTVLKNLTRLEKSSKNASDEAVAYCQYIAAFTYRLAYPYDPNSVKMAQESLENFQDLDNRRMEGVLLRTVALAHQTMKLMDKSLVTIVKALAVFKEVDDLSQWAHTAIQRGRIYIQQREWNAALGMAREAADTFERIGDKVGVAESRLMEASVRFQMERFQDSGDKAFEALKVFQACSWKAGEGFAYTLISDIQIELGNLDKGVAAARRAAEAFKGGSHEEEAATLMLLTRAILQRITAADFRKASFAFHENLKEARESSYKAIELAQRCRSLQLAANVYLAAAEMELLDFRPDMSVVHAAEAREIFQKMGQEAQEAKCLDVQAVAHMQVGMHEKAWHLARGAQDIFERIRDKNGVMQMNQLLERIEKLYVPPRALKKPAQAAAATAAAAAPQPEEDAPQKQKKTGEIRSREQAVDLSDYIQLSMQEALSDLLGDHVELDSPLMASGLSSGMAMAMKGQLEEDFSVMLPSTLLFDYPSVISVAEFIVGKLGTNALPG